MTAISSSSKIIVPAVRTNNIKYAVRDVMLVAQKAAASGKEMLYLNIGDPNAYDFKTPDHLIDAIHKAMQKNLNGYAPSSGIPAALESINKEAARKGIKSIVHTYITSGASEAIELALSALVNPGENVLTPSPGYPLYTAILSKLSVENRPYYLDEEDGWQPDLADIKNKIDDKTKVIVLINPNNPTGSLYTPEILQAIVTLAKEKNIVVFSDEIYDKLVFDGKSHVSTASLDSDAKIITFNGLSKSYLGPGLRMGWGIISGPAEELTDYCEAIQKMERARLCANHPIQYAIPPALEGDQSHIKEMLQRLTIRRDITTQRLNSIPGISCVKPGGAFYAYPKIELNNNKNITTDEEFVKELIMETGVVVVPGNGFGQRPGTNHFRVVFLPPDDILEKAFTKISEVMQRYR